MDKEKQIEEMCAIMADASYAACEDTPLVPESAGICDKVDCHRCKEARRLMNAGYRKASDVAEEIIKDLVKFADDKERQMSFHGHSVWYIDADDVTDFIAELKKKYESEKEDGI